MKWISSHCEESYWGEGRLLSVASIAGHINKPAEHKLPPLTIERVKAHRRGKKPPLQLLPKRNPGNPCIAISIEIRGDGSHEYLKLLDSRFFQNRLYYETEGAKSTAYLVISFQPWAPGAKFRPPSRTQINTRVDQIEASLRAQAFAEGSAVSLQIGGTYNIVRLNDYKKASVRRGRPLTAPRCTENDSAQRLWASRYSDDQMSWLIGWSQRNHGMIYCRLLSKRRQKNVVFETPRRSAIKCGREAITELLPFAMRSGLGVTAEMIAAIDCHAKSLWDSHGFGNAYGHEIRQYAFNDLIRLMLKSYDPRKASQDVWFYDEDMHQAYRLIDERLTPEILQQIDHAARKHDGHVGIFELALTLCIALKFSLCFLGGAVPQVRVKGMLIALGVPVAKGGIVSLLINSLLEIQLLLCLDRTTARGQARRYRVTGPSSSLPFVSRVFDADLRQRRFLEQFQNGATAPQATPVSRKQTDRLSIVYRGDVPFAQEDVAGGGVESGVEQSGFDGWEDDIWLEVDRNFDDAGNSEFWEDDDS